MRRIKVMFNPATKEWYATEDLICDWVLSANEIELDIEQDNPKRYPRKKDKNTFNGFRPITMREIYDLREIAAYDGRQSEVEEITKVIQIGKDCGLF